MSDDVVMSAAVLALLAFPISVAAPLIAACMLVSAWRSSEQASAWQSRVTHDAVERSRTVLGALELR
jgi:hypothetical protein